ncbi:uncharacterized protein LOC126686718 [Mercurialis annua]|uniref:uncharacterized protein LOC126686718 n=1 Tax=Mercurialis annua TaxID=3986 RepID=UPI00215E3A5E|nr:uncharacterized protein LOC126686718 [Mercurialis annua]
MNSTSSSSSSSSGAPTTSFDASPSCLSAIFCRLFCSRALPTHPSDIHQQHSTKSFDVPHQAAASSPPGIVARLMGLETNFTEVSANSISRSKSLNFVEFSDQKHHTRAKSSTFAPLGMPTFLELENEEFFILSFEKRGDWKETRDTRRKSKEFRAKRNKENKNENVQLKKKEDKEDIMNNDKEQLTVVDQEIGKIEDSAKASLPLRELCRMTTAKQDWINCKEMKKKRRHGRRLKSEEEEEEECSSEESSPVSVLDFDPFVVPTKSEEDGSSRRKLSSALEDSNSKRREAAYHNDNQVVEFIWRHKMIREFQDFEEITAEIELQIFNELLEELLV